MIATTIINSIRVKPFWIDFIEKLLLQAKLLKVQKTAAIRTPAPILEQGLCQQRRGISNLLI
jgi:hypothetical protein